MKKLTNIALLLIARIMQIVLSPILIVWGFVQSLRKGEYSQWSYELAIAIDRFGNCLGKYAFNDILGEGFGNSKETISSRLGKNKVLEKLKPFGKLTANTLDKLDKNHCVKSIDLNV